MKKENYSKIFIILCAINISCLLVSNIITVKTVSILGLIFTAGDILFPITYILMMYLQKSMDLINQNL